MSDHTWRSYRFDSIRRQIERVAGDHERRLRQSRVERVLAILENDNLINRAATDLKSADCMIFECNFANEVWDDPRITFRVRQLAANDVKVDVIENRFSAAGKTFTRTQIRVTISG